AIERRPDELGAYRAVARVERRIGCPRRGDRARRARRDLARENPQAVVERSPWAADEAGRCRMAGEARIPFRGFHYALERRRRRRRERADAFSARPRDRLRAEPKLEPVGRLDSVERDVERRGLQEPHGHGLWGEARDAAADVAAVRGADGAVEARWHGQRGHRAESKSLRGP